MINTTGRYTDHELTKIYLDFYDDLDQALRPDAGDEASERLEREIPLPDGGSFIGAEYTTDDDEALLKFLGAYVALFRSWLQLREGARHTVRLVRANGSDL